MSSARFIVGDVFDVLASLPDASADMVLTSPPYFTLRSYLPPDHPDKAREIGQEPSPGDFLEALLTVMDALGRVLSDDGTFWINLGDTHAGSGGGDGEPGDLRPGGRRRETQPRSHGTARKARREQGYRNDDQDGGPLRDRARDESLGITPRRLRTRRTLPGYPDDQSVCWLPHLFGASLAYGRNLLTGAEHRRWVTRPPITWCKPSVTPGREGRKFRSATELIIYGGKHQAHYFDLDATRSDVGAPPFNWWKIATKAYAGAHFATFPPDLCVQPILAGSPHGGLVLDPFAGSGVTGAVAIGHGRDALLIDIDERNVPLARDRVGMFLEVEHREAVA